MCLEIRRGLWERLESQGVSTLGEKSFVTLRSCIYYFLGIERGVRAQEGGDTLMMRYARDGGKGLLVVDVFSIELLCLYMRNLLIRGCCPESARCPCCMMICLDALSDHRTAQKDAIRSIEVLVLS